MSSFTQVEKDAAQLAASNNLKPVSIAVDAGAMQFYFGGIISASDCGTSLDHGVLLVGYNEDQKYWKIKNSWGEYWGENGYCRFEYPANTCGILNDASYPTIWSSSSKHHHLFILNPLNPIFPKERATPSDTAVSLQKPLYNIYSAFNSFILSSNLHNSILCTNSLEGLYN